MSATAGQSQSASRSRARGRNAGGIRVDRIGRTAICLAAVVLGFLFVKPLVGLVGAAIARSDASGQLDGLKRENRQLKARRDALRRDTGVAQEARQLGMVLPGEVPYVVTGPSGRGN